MKAAPERADYPTGPAPDYTEGQPARSCRRGLEKRSARTVLRRYLAGALLTALFSMTLAACAKKHHIDIQSNTCWTAVIDQEGGKQQGGNHGVCSMRLNARYGKPVAALGQQLAEA